MLRLLLGLLAVGLAFSGVLEALSALVALTTGSRRRFTGSREEASFAGNSHPVTSWLSDPVQQIDPDRWHLKVHGEEVEGEPTLLSYEQVLALGDLSTAREATLDCTGGWYTTQRWGGVAVADVLEQVGFKDGARSVVLRSSSGYSRRFSLDEAGELLLATHVEGEALSGGHGFPLRLVAPAHRGHAWVKWVAELEVSGEPGWLESPLPLQ